MLHVFALNSLKVSGLVSTLVFFPALSKHFILRNISILIASTMTTYSYWVLTIRNPKLTKFNSIKKYSLHKWQFITISLHLRSLLLNKRAANGLRQLRQHTLVSTGIHLLAPQNIRANLFQKRILHLVKDAGFHDTKAQFRHLERHSYGRVTPVNKWRQIYRDDDTTDTSKTSHWFEYQKIKKDS